jgi:hypothetical protein
MYKVKNDKQILHSLYQRMFVSSLTVTRRISLVVQEQFTSPGFSLGSYFTVFCFLCNVLKSLFVVLSLFFLPLYCLSVCLSSVTSGYLCAIVLSVCLSVLLCDFWLSLCHYIVCLSFSVTSGYLCTIVCLSVLLCDFWLSLCHCLSVCPSL